MEKIYWKVVKSDLTSATMRKHGKVQYSFTEWAEAPEWLRERGYHLLVFDSFERALEFASQEPTTKVLVCECEDEVTPLPDICWYVDIDQSRGYLMLSLYQGVWPSGTRMFKRVKLVETTLKQLKLKESRET